MYGVYATSDGFIAVAAIEAHFAERLAAHIGQTHEQLTQRFATHPTTYWTSLGQAQDIPLVAVAAPGEPITEYAVSATTAAQE